MATPVPTLSPIPGAFRATDSPDQFNQSSYRKPFNPNITQKSFGFKNSQSVRVKNKHPPQKLLRELSNQRGESIGFATAYNYTEKLRN